MSIMELSLRRSHMGSATDLRFPLSAVVHAPAEPFGTAPGLPRTQKGRFAARREEPAKVTHPPASTGPGAGSELGSPCTLVPHLPDRETWGNFLHLASDDKIGFPAGLYCG